MQLNKNPLMCRAYRVLEGGERNTTEKNTYTLHQNIDGINEIHGSAVE